jgi:hypothetical protein
MLAHTNLIHSFVFCICHSFDHRHSLNMIRSITAAALVLLVASPGMASPVASKRDVGPPLGLPSSSPSSGGGTSVPGLGEVTDVLRTVPELGALIPSSDEDPTVLKARQIPGGTSGVTQVLSEVTELLSSGGKQNTKRGILGVPADVSLPPVIPSIPGVTEPLASNAPPLPILQPPTPPLDSPPFQGSSIKPKKIGYFWTGAGDNEHKDFLVTTSLDDANFPSAVPAIANQHRILLGPSSRSPTSRAAVTHLITWGPPLMARLLSEADFCLC